MNQVTKIDSKALAEHVDEISQESAEIALRDAGLGIDLKKVLARKVVGQFFVGNTAGHIMAESISIRDQMERVRAILAARIESCEKPHELQSLVASFNDTVRNVATLSLVELKCAEISAVSTRGRKQKQSAPSIISENTYVQINKNGREVVEPPFDT